MLSTISFGWSITICCFIVALAIVALILFTLSMIRQGVGAGYKEGVDSVKTQKDPSKVYIMWSWRDIQSLQPNWTEEQCQEALWKHSETLKDVSISRGWECLEDLIGRDEDE